MKISAVIIAGNEEEKIAGALASLDWADEILVIDSESTDRTREIAASFGARVIARPWPGFAAQKQFGVDNAVHDWVFSLDADEVVSESLKNEIAELRGRDLSGVGGCKIPRTAIYMGREIRHSGWYPDWQLRLFDRRRAHWKDVLIHESVEVDNGRVEKLAGPIIHHSIDNPGHHHAMIGTRYAPLAAQQLFEQGSRTSPLRIATAGPITFLSTYVLKAGFLDGLPGYCIARFAAHHAFLKHLNLWELQRGRAKR